MYYNNQNRLQMILTYQQAAEFMDTFPLVKFNHPIPDDDELTGDDSKPDTDEYDREGDWDDEEDEDFEDHTEALDDLHEVQVDDDLHEPDPEDDDHLPDDDLQ